MSYRPPSIIDFKFLNYKQHLCPDKVNKVFAKIMPLFQIDQSYGSCLDECESEPYQYTTFGNCYDGRCIKYDKYCNGIRDCRSGEDETVEECQVSNYEVPSNFFPCTKTGHLINSDQVAKIGVVQKNASFTQVCNGLRDCPEGEDEDSVLWFRQDFNLAYQGETRNWTNLNLD